MINRPDNIAPNITRMLLEDVLKAYWKGTYPLFNNEPLVCKLCEDKGISTEAHALSFVAKHMRKIHKIYIARGDTMRRLYHTKDLLPGSNLRYNEEVEDDKNGQLE